MLDYYKDSVNSAFENDIIKSTTDFMDSVMEMGLQSKTIEINTFVKALSQSDFQTFDTVYQIFFQTLQTRENHFKLFNLLNDEKEIRVGKLKIGQILIEKYSQTPLNESEKNIINETNAISQELESETREKNIQLENKKVAIAERKRKQEELKNKKK